MVFERSIRLIGLLALYPLLSVAEVADHLTRLATASAYPNVVIILADDMGYGDVSCYNSDSKIATPHIDQIAAEGLRFMDAHSASGTCTPSRYGLLTGVNPARTGVRNTLLKKGAPIISEHEATLATMFSDHRYKTAMVGKWHLGFEMVTSADKPAFDFSKALSGGPLDRGFDTFFGIHSSPGAGPYFYIRDRSPVNKPTEWTKGFSGREDRQGLEQKRTTWASGSIAPGYDPEMVGATLCDEAVSIIHRHAESKGNQPLFLYYALASPHAPWLPEKEYAGKSAVGAYGDFVMQLDAEVGRVHAALKESGLAQNTILIFTSDNGPRWLAADIKKYGHRAAGALRGSKAFSYEGGHRVPFIVKWPSEIRESSVSASTINFTDVFATFADVLEVPAEDMYLGSFRDSHSFLASMRTPNVRHSRAAMVNTPDCIRVGDWKLIASKRGGGPEAQDLNRFELYYLLDDLSEEINLISDNPERANHLFLKYQKFLSERSLK